MHGPEFRSIFSPTLYDRPSTKQPPLVERLYALLLKCGGRVVVVVVVLVVIFTSVAIETGHSYLI